MKKKLLIFIMLAIISLGGMVMVFSLNREIKAAKAVRTAQEEKRNREYEESLVKALKNSYRDLEEIHLNNPRYLDKPGTWNCRVILFFSDGKKIEFGTSHTLNDKEFSKGGIMRQSNENWDYLLEKRGETNSEIKVIYSNEKEETI